MSCVMCCQTLWVSFFLFFSAINLKKKSTTTRMQISRNRKWWNERMNEFKQYFWTCKTHAVQSGTRVLCQKIISGFYMLPLTVTIFSWNLSVRVTLVVHLLFQKCKSSTHEILPLFNNIMPLRMICCVQLELNHLENFPSSAETQVLQRI